MADGHKNWVVSKRKFREFAAAHPELAHLMKPLMAWHRTATRAEWATFADVRASYGSADQVGPYVVFNIGGNKLRLVAEIFYRTKPRMIYIRHVLTHREYDRGGWKAE